MAPLMVAVEIENNRTNDIDVTNQNPPVHAPPNKVNPNECVG